MCDCQCTAKLILGNKYIVCLWIAPSASGSILVDHAKELSYIMAVTVPTAKHVSFH